MKVLLSEDRKIFFVDETRGKYFSTHLGNINLDELKNKKFGDVILSSKGKKFIVIYPNIDEIKDIIKRGPQITHPKDLGYILTKICLKDDLKILEIGTGCGYSTIFFSIIAKNGKVVSYEYRKDFYELAKKNIEVIENILGLKLNITLKNEKFDKSTKLEDTFDFVFIDIPNPEDIIENISKNVVNGGLICLYLPNTTQIIKLFSKLPKNVSIDEIVRIVKEEWTIDKDILRPKNTQLYHTAFMVFLRKI